MKLFIRNNFIARIAVLPTIFTLITGCGLMHDDTPPCATDPRVTVLVNFIYDYNMEDVDLFDRQAGSVFLYIFDEKGIFQSRYEKTRMTMSDPSHPDFSMTFEATDNLELEMGKTYQFVAVASDSDDGYNEDDEAPGFKLVNRMIPGVSTINDYILRLNRDDKMFSDFGVVDYTSDYSSEDAMIETVWTTKPDEVQVHTIPYLKAEFDSPNQLPDYVEEVKIPMMRITNSIEIALTSPSFTSATKSTDYDILIYFPNGNGTIDFVGETLTEISQPLYYRALRKRVDTYTDNRGSRADEDSATDGAQQYAIYATFGVSRLKYDDGASLQVRDPETHEILAQIDNFSQYLNDRGNMDYDDPQEYLDREFDFRVNIGLTPSDDLWWSQVGIGIHDWAVKDWYIGL